MADCGGMVLPKGRRLVEDVDWWRSRGLVQKPRIESHGLEIRGWKVPTVQGTEDITLGPSDYNLNVASTVGFFQPRISNPWHPSFLPSFLPTSFVPVYFLALSQSVCAQHFIERFAEYCTQRFAE